MKLYLRNSLKNVASFLAYHNAVPILAAVLVLGASSAFAATTGLVPALSGTATSSATRSGAPNTAYLRTVDLTVFQPTAKVTNVTEDASNYYVAYQLSTIALVQGVWQLTTQDKTLTVPKAVLGSRDLGEYVGTQLAAKTAQELAYLKRVQTIERNKAAGTETATAYAGLVGKTLQADSTAVPNYTPVVQNAVHIDASAVDTAATTPTPTPTTKTNQPQLITTSAHTALTQTTDTAATTTATTSAAHATVAATTTASTSPDKIVIGQMTIIGGDSGGGTTASSSSDTANSNLTQTTNSTTSAATTATDTSASNATTSATTADVATTQTTDTNAHTPSTDTAQPTPLTTPTGTTSSPTTN